jgi:hypothetical protein
MNKCAGIINNNARPKNNAEKTLLAGPMRNVSLMKNIIGNPLNSMAIPAE